MHEKFPVILIAGLSGAGKSTAINVFEDMRFFTVDGLPADLLPGMSGLLTHNALPQYKGLVLGVDLRQHSSAQEFTRAVVELRQQDLNPIFIFLEAEPAVIMSRYMTTRRPHPLENEGMGLEQAIAQEKSRLQPVRDLANLVLDTSTWSVHDLRRNVQKKSDAMFAAGHSFKVHLVSFGFKYGLPAETDMMFDLRFLPNPYFVEGLRPLSGQNAEVADYVLQSQAGQSFVPRLQDFLHYLLPLYESEGRYRLTVSFGCTGGRHRSVAITEHMATVFARAGYAVSIEHRHLELG